MCGGIGYVIRGCVRELLSSGLVRGEGIYVGLEGGGSSQVKSPWEALNAKRMRARASLEGRIYMWDWREGGHVKSSHLGRHLTQRE